MEKKGFYLKIVEPSVGADDSVRPKQPPLQGTTVDTAAKEPYQEAYFLMVRATEKARRAMERQNFGLAWDELITAQRQAEELLLQDEKNGDS